MLICIIESIIDVAIACLGVAVLFGICYFGGRMMLQYCNKRERRNPRHSGRRAHY